jgi:hypothetical protein
MDQVYILKAKVERDHHILEIGSGWGSLAIQVVKQTGCKYTGITLSGATEICSKKSEGSWLRGWCYFAETLQATLLFLCLLVNCCHEINILGSYVIRTT